MLSLFHTAATGSILRAEQKLLLLFCQTDLWASSDTGLPLRWGTHRSTWKLTLYPLPEGSSWMSRWRSYTGSKSGLLFAAHRSSGEFWWSLKHVFLCVFLSSKQSVETLSGKYKKFCLFYWKDQAFGKRPLWFSLFIKRYRFTAYNTSVFLSSALYTCQIKVVFHIVTCFLGD